VEGLQRDIAAISTAAMELRNGWFVDLGENAAAMAAGTVGRALVLAATIELTYSRRDDEAALALLAEVERLGVPLAPLLRHVGRHAVARNDHDAAFEYHGLLEALQPGGLWTYLRVATGQPLQRFAPAALDHCLRAARPLFYDMQAVKAALVRDMGMAGAAMLLADAIHPRAPWRLRRLPLAGLLAHAREHGVALEEVIAPRDVKMTPPDVFGEERARGFSGRSRSVSVCELADATVWGKSNLVRAGDRVLLDHQGTELERIPLNLDTNPPVVAAADGHVVFVEHDAPARLPDLRVAMSLAGLHSYNYAHWIFEHMFPLWACMDRPGFAGVTLLVDAQMPAQHRELLEFCVGRDHPVVVLGAGQSVRVERLWACSKIAYWPGGEKPPVEPVHDYELSDVAAVAGLLRKLEPRLEALDVAGLPERIYLTRQAELGRSPDDRPAIEAAFAGRGFAVLDFAAMPMREQLRHLRAARTVVMEAGAPLLYGALFCRPGTRIGELCDEKPAEQREWCAEMFRALGMHLLLFPGASAAGPADRDDSEGTGVDLDRLDAYLKALESDLSRS
jgi:capsular polysaccharide biosynthesis protein